MKVSDYIAQFLSKRGIDSVFGYSGGAITHLMDSLKRNPDIHFVQTYHEQTAAIAAEGYAWRSKKFGVAMATSGPGATNLITGIADAYFDSIPVLYITGQVNTYEYRGDKPIRQQGFQETDIVSIVKPITKYAAMVMETGSVRYELEKALDCMMEGRRGPVLLDFPMDIQRGDIDVDVDVVAKHEKPIHAVREPIEYMNGFSSEELKRLLRDSARPILLLGSGAILADASSTIRKLARKFQLPVVVSLLGKGAFSEDDRLFVGMIGSYGNRCANMALANADLVISIGSRLDTRQTGTNLSSFVRSGKIIRVDIDRNEILFHRLKDVHGVAADARSFVEDLLGCTPDVSRPRWLSFIAELKEQYNQDQEIVKNVNNKKPYQAMDILNRFAAPDQLFSIDIGQNQMFAAQKLRIVDGQSWKTSGGLAPMGYAIPAAIGASFAAGHHCNIFAVVGDGGLQISSQSLMLLSQYYLPIKVILINNKALGMITQFQDLYFDRRKEGTTQESGYSVPDFGLMAKAYRLDYHRISGPSYDDEGELALIFKKPGPSLIEFDVGEDTVVYPKLEVNMPIEDVSPRLSREELRKVMLIDVL